MVLRNASASKNNSVPSESDNGAIFPQKILWLSRAMLVFCHGNSVVLKGTRILGFFLFPTLTMRPCGCKRFWLGRGGMENFPEKTIIRSQEEKGCLTSKVSISFQHNVVETKDTLKE